MKDSLQYIEAYFTGELKDGERVQFEEKCERDPEFAREVSLYISMRGALRRSFHEAKKEDFQSFYKEDAPEEVQSKKNVKLYAWLSGIAASVLIVGALLYFDRPDPEKLATTYIEENLQTLSVTMGAEQDSLALGVNAYNDGDYGTAEVIFKSLLKHPSVEFNSLKYLGLVSLKTNSYESAVKYFDQLASIKNMYANPGPFYKAVTLMKRSEGNDVNEAKRILEDVVSNKMAGHKEAERWLQELE